LEKAANCSGESRGGRSFGQPAKLRHNDRDARWTIKFTRAKTREDGTTPPVDIAIPTFGYQNHVSIDRGL
jgi:transposase, IS5 family